MQSTTINNGTLPSRAPGHVFLGGSLTLPPTVPVIVGSTVIAAGATLSIPITCDAAGQNFTVLQSNWIEGSFASIETVGCNDCGASLTSAQNAGSMTVTVTLSCAGLSRGAIVGIVLGSVVGGTMVALGVVFLIRYSTQWWQRELTSEAHAKHMAELKETK